LTLPLASPAETVSPPSQATPPTTRWAGPLRIDDAMAFDIPPQPLLTALQTYSEITGQAVLVDNALATGRRTPGVHGSFDKTQALQKLLAGTGLVASYSSDQAFTLKLAEPDATVDRTVRDKAQSLGVEESEAVIENYAGKIQQPIEAALCQSDDAHPGTYRLAMQIWIAASGHIEKTRLLSAVDSQRAYAVHHALNNLVLEPPPAGMPQPLTLLLLPKHADDVSACAATRPTAH
jgi:hypothetical protein